MMAKVPSHNRMQLIAMPILLLFLQSIPSLSEQQQTEQICDSNSDHSTCVWSSSSSPQEQEELHENEHTANNIILPDDFIDPCQDKDEHCYEWAVEGECRRNLHFMLTSCARSCGSCHSLPRGSRGFIQEETTTATCFDEHAGHECHKWAMEGECLINPSFMLSKCKYSCWECVDRQHDEKLGIANVEIQKKVMYATMDKGKQQLIREITEGDTNNNPMTSEGRQKVISTVRQMDHYAKHILTDASIDTKTRQRCRNEFQMCAEWASRGLCHSTTPRSIFHLTSHKDDSDNVGDLVYNHDNTGGRTKNDVMFMMNFCPLACRTCHLLESFHKCAGRRHPRAQPSFQSDGELRSFFDKFSQVIVGDDTIRSHDWTKYEPLLAAYPNHTEKGIRDRSYVAIFRNFLSDAEADHLKLLGSAIGWTAKFAATTTWTDDTVTNINNAEYARCHDDNRCESDEMYQQIMNRIVSLSDSITSSHLEPMEFTRLYSTSADESLQHNFEIRSLWEPAGPRVLSISLFLSSDTNNNNNDGSEEGVAGIGFPHLNWLTVRPRKGMAILWPNVMDSNLFEPDWSTSFEFMPLRGGDASVVVSTVHVRMHNYTDATIRGCA